MVEIGAGSMRPPIRIHTSSSRGIVRQDGFRIDKERGVLEAGGTVVIPGGAEHEGWCHEDTEIIDIFAPPREDFLAGGGPTWLREKS